MKPGDRVEKTFGYHFPGIVLAVFRTVADKERVVVEMYLKDEPTGLLHIFDPTQLKVVANETDASGSNGPYEDEIPLRGVPKD